MPDNEHNRFRGRVRPGKSASLLGMIAGIGFVIFGLSMMGGSGVPGGMPSMGFPAPFMVLWLVVAGGIAVFHGYNYFSERGASTMEVDLELPVQSSGVFSQSAQPASSESASGAAAGDFAERLRKLEQLRDDRLISEQEYQDKRTQILAERW
jgi:hypothetical protein